MKSFVLAAAVATGLGVVGGALAQGNVVTERRAGLDRMERQFEAIAGVVQQRGDQRTTIGQVDEMIAFFRTMPDRFPSATLTPPLPGGRADGLQPPDEIARSHSGRHGGQVQHMRARQIRVGAGDSEVGHV